MITRVTFNHSINIEGSPKQAVLGKDWEIDFSTGHHGPGIMIDITDEKRIFVPMSNIVSIDETF